MSSGLRLSTADAVKRGLISETEAQNIDNAGKGRRYTAAPEHLAADLPKKPMLGPAAKALAAAQREGNEVPQRLLYEALCERLPGVPEWEREGLVPGRKFRADIFLPPDITIELDGLKFHSSKTAFQQDRLRSNLFVIHGFRVMRAFTKQCLDVDMRTELVDQIVQAYNTRKYSRAEPCKCGQ